MNRIIFIPVLLSIGLIQANPFNVGGGVMFLNEEHFENSAGWTIDITHIKPVNSDISLRYQISYSRVTAKREIGPEGWSEYPVLAQSYNTIANIPSAGVSLQHHPFSQAAFSNYVSPYFWLGIGIHGKLYSSEYKSPGARPLSFDSEYYNFPEKDWVAHVFPIVGTGVAFKMFPKKDLLIEYQMDYSRRILPVPVERPSISSLRVSWNTRL